MRVNEFEQYESVDVAMDKEKIVMIVMPDPGADPRLRELRLPHGCRFQGVVAFARERKIQ